jgi:toxin ParE1/3/4
MQIVWSPQSLHDLDAIREYIAQDSEHYAELTIERIFSVVEQLHRFPQSGRAVPERDVPENSRDHRRSFSGCVSASWRK